MKIVDIRVQIEDDNGQTIVLDNGDMLSFEVAGVADYHDFLTGGAWAADGQTRRHHLHWGNDWTFVITLAHHEVVPATETVELEY